MQVQEEVEQKTLTLIINSTKFSGRTLKSAIHAYMTYRKESQGQSSTAGKNDRKAAGRTESGHEQL